MEYFTLRNGAKMPAIGCGTVTFGREGGKLENPIKEISALLIRLLKLDTVFLIRPLHTATKKA